jgi:uncharacterized repeat protein (TIGR01451 family)
MNFIWLRALFIIILIVSMSEAQPLLKVTESAVDTSNNKPLADGDSIKPETTIQYTLTVENIGNEDALDIRVTNWLSPDVQFVRALGIPSNGSIISKPNPSLGPKSLLQKESIDVSLKRISPGETNKKEITIEVKTPSKGEGPMAIYNHIMVWAKNVKENIFDEFRLIMQAPYEASYVCDDFYPDCIDDDCDNFFQDCITNDCQSSHSACKAEDSKT